MVDMEELVVREEVLKEGTEGRYREGVVYKVNSQKPFTGTAKSEYSSPAVVHGFLNIKRGSGYGLGQLITLKDGKLNGPFVTRGNQKKILIKTNLKGAKIEGFFEEYYPNGQLKVKFKAKDGSVQGRYESYHNNGQLEVITDCNQKVPEYFAFEKYKKWDRQGLPSEELYKTMFFEVKEGSGFSIGKATTRMNYAKSGWKSLLKKSKRKFKKIEEISDLILNAKNILNKY